MKRFVNFFKPTQDEKIKNHKALIKTMEKEKDEKKRVYMLSNYLSDHGIDINGNISDKDGIQNTLLSYAFEKNCLRAAETLLQQGADVNKPFNDQKWTVLHNACVTENSEKLVSLLLQYGADYEIRAEHNETALHFACSWDNTEVIKLLLQRNADRNARNSSGKKPFDLLLKAEIKQDMENYVKELETPWRSPRQN